MREIWKPINGYEGLYEISNTGRVNSLISGRILKTYPNNKGYLYVRLTKDGQHKAFSVHRLVANAFIPNTERMEQVNHIDGNKQNNYSENLEWCKPCPFCGGEKLIITDCRELEECFKECENGCFYVVCCDFTNGGCGATSGYRPNAGEAIEAWNRRAGEQE